MNRTKRASLSKYIYAVVFVCIGALNLAAGEDAPEDRPNILLIAIDDLNDWVGCLGGHPQVKTPYIDRLANRGVLFTNAHAQAVTCNPSRTSMMTSLYPHTSGIHGMATRIAKTPAALKSPVLPMRFHEEGYAVGGAGKLFHHHENIDFFPAYGGLFGAQGPYPPGKKMKFSPYPGKRRSWDWGVYPETDEELPDHMVASWGIAQLAKTHGKPAFTAVGFYNPHVPLYAPKKWYDLYPLSSVELPPVKEDDLADLPATGAKMALKTASGPSHEWVLEHEQWKPLAQSYLACVSAADHQVGRVLDALDQRSGKENTIIVLYSDHGWHLGEKEHWAKRTLWTESTRVPMIIVAPGLTRGAICRKPVELIDIYPTLLELAGLEKDPNLEGHSLVPLLKDPEADWPHIARTTFNPGNVAIISERYRYIRYSDGSEEFYDHQNDPNEWTNLAEDPEVAELMEDLKSHLPKDGITQSDTAKQP